MTLLRIGPDGLLLVEAFGVSALAAVLAWRRVRPAAGIPAMLAAGVALSVWQALLPDANPSWTVKLVASAFVLVPSALLLGASRLRVVAQHAWILLLGGPVVFLGCYVGICTACVKAHLI
jgi:hypothetical protein